jgi:hypothetical protein
MTKHTSALDALEAFFAAVRRQAETDADFAAEILTALQVPLEVHINTASDVQKNMLFLDPVVHAGKGLDEFRKTFGSLSDAEKKKIIKAYNLAPADALQGKGGPKGMELVDLMWEAATEKRRRLEIRS